MKMSYILILFLILAFFALAGVATLYSYRTLPTITIPSSISKDGFSVPVKNYTGRGNLNRFSFKDFKDLKNLHFLLSKEFTLYDDHMEYRTYPNVGSLKWDEVRMVNK